MGNQIKDFSYVVSFFSNTKNVYFLASKHHSFLLGVGDDGNNFILGARIRQLGGSINDEAANKILEELSKQSITFQCIDCDKITSYIGDKKNYSSNGQFYWEYLELYLARDDTPLNRDSKKYLAQSNFGTGSSTVNWVNQDEGVILHPGLEYLIGQPGGFVFPTGFIEVPYPILLLKVPEEYQSPENRALHETLRRKEQTAGVLAVLIPALLTGILFYRRKRNVKKAK